MKAIYNILLACTVFCAAACTAQTNSHVIIVMLDGVRYSESFGAKDTLMTHIWDDLRPQGTIYTNFRNEGPTLTCPGHAAVLTGEWQNIANDGSQQFPSPTIFEYYRKQTGMPEQSCAVVSGKPKLLVLTHSSDSIEYGSRYEAAFYVDEPGKNMATWKKLSAVMTQTHPNAIIVNFPETDLKGHAGKWYEYLAAIHEADSLVWLLWKQVQSDSIYRNTTTVFVTNDHGRHDDQHGGFKNHGDSCEGCRHIMLLALGPQFKAGAQISTEALQIDIAPTAAEILGFTMPPVQGRSLLYSETKKTR